MNESLSNTTHPSIGRFLNRDPIGFAGGYNLFSYAGNSPVTEVDPTGLIPPSHDPYVTQYHFDGSAGADGRGKTARTAIGLIGATILSPFLVAEAGPTLLVWALGNPVEAALAAEGIAATAIGYPGPGASLPINARVAGGAVTATMEGRKGFATASVTLPVEVTRVFRNNCPPGSGNKLMSAAMNGAGFKPGQDLILRHIQNPETRNALKSGASFADTLVGRMTSRAVENLGGKVRSFELLDTGRELKVIVKTK